MSEYLNIQMLNAIKIVNFVLEYSYVISKYAYRAYQSQYSSGIRCVTLMSIIPVVAAYVKFIVSYALSVTVHGPRDTRRPYDAKISPTN